MTVLLCIFLWSLSPSRTKKKYNTLLIFLSKSWAFPLIFWHLQGLYLSSILALSIYWHYIFEPGMRSKFMLCLEWLITILYSSSERWAKYNFTVKQDYVQREWMMSCSKQATHSILLHILMYMCILSWLRL